MQPSKGTEHRSEDAGTSQSMGSGFCRSTVARKAKSSENCTHREIYDATVNVREIEWKTVSLFVVV
jgi:hypothetical protein